MNWIQNIVKSNNKTNEKLTEVPRRALTKESTEELSTTINDTLHNMLSESCPCHYPRFRYLVQFHHQKYKAGPVFCAETNYLISISTAKELNYLKLTDKITGKGSGDYSADLIFTCLKCGTKYQELAHQYSINFEFSYLTIIDPKFGDDIGAAVSIPIPLFQGLFGFMDNDILKCSSEFKQGTSQELFDYLVEKKLDKH